MLRPGDAMHWNVHQSLRLTLRADKDMLPSELAIRRAREILEMLRSRASEPELPRLERDYIDRLLRGLY